MLACSPAGQNGGQSAGQNAGQGDGQGDGQSDHETGDSSGERELVVFAAASLRDAFEALGAAFRSKHQGVDVIFNFAGSQQLRTQIEHGAVADVLASANQVHMDAVRAQGLAGEAAIFARNELVVVVPRGVGTLRRFEDLPSAQRVVIGASEVPVGRYTRQVLERAAARWPGFAEQVMARVVSQELNVRQVLAKVALGEGDAGIVYRTDAAAMPSRVDVIAIPDELNVVASYPIAALTRAPHPTLAAAWIDFVRAPEGQAMLARAGFVSGSVPGSVPDPVHGSVPAGSKTP